MAKSYLDKDGLLYFLQSIRPNTTPNMDGTAATGSAKRFALQDHVHPSDTSRVPTTRKVNGKALSSDITLSASDVSALPSSTVIPSPGTGDNYPAMDGTKALGSNAGYARVDHVHPSDTNKVDKVSGKGLSTNDYTTAEKNKLSGIASGAEVNQNAFSNITVSYDGSSSDTIQADTKTDTLTIAAGNNITLTSDLTNDKVTIAARDTTYSNATTTTAGLMSSSDKSKLEGIESGAEVNQNAYSNVKVGSTTIAAGAKTDTLELAGSNVTLTPDATNDKVTIGITASNVTTALGNTAVARATGDASGNNIASTYAPKASPALSGTPTAPTAAAGTNTTQIATTAFVTSAITATGGEPNQNAFSKIKIGSTNVIADDPTDTLELVGSNVTLTPDGTDDKITIGITASNVTTALGNTAVARATADHMGNNINSIYAPKASPALSGTPTAPTAAAGTNTTQIATTAFVTSAIQTAQTGAATFQGTAPTSFAPTNYKKGYYWVVGTAGTYAGQVCEPGDMIFAVKDYASAYAASDFNVIQTNLDITSITNAEIDTIVAA